jgi:hypothetical protein
MGASAGPAPRVHAAIATAVSALVTLVAVVSVPREARAFCRTTTDPIPADFTPDPGTAGGCWVQGKPLYWTNACVGYNLQKDASHQVSVEAASQALAAAFAKWTGTACPTDGTGRSRTSIDVRDLGPVDCSLVQYNQDQGNQHVIVFRDDSWPHADSNNTLALTTVTFNPDTGEIYDADMEINTHDQRVTLSDPVPADGYDFAAIVTHETGHFLGLAHSADAHATMYAHYQPGSTAMRNLTSDDVQGICSIYAPDGTRAAAAGAVPELSCDPTPRHGFSTTCGVPQKKGCIPAATIGRASAVDTAASTCALGVVLTALLLRRLRRTRAPLRAPLR